MSSMSSHFTTQFVCGVQSETFCHSTYRFFLWQLISKKKHFQHLFKLMITYPDNTHLSQRHPLDVVLGRLQRPKDSSFFRVLVFGTGFGCGNVCLVIIQLLCPAQPMGRILDVLSTYFTPVLYYKIFFSFTFLIIPFVWSSGETNTGIFKLQIRSSELNSKFQNLRDTTISKITTLACSVVV
jgi:hypothetical protein